MSVVIYLFILFIIISVILFLHSSPNKSGQSAVLQAQSGGVSNVFGHPMFLVNDDLDLDINNNRIIDSNPFKHYNNINQQLYNQISKGNDSVNRSHGVESVSTIMQNYDNNFHSEFDTDVPTYIT